MAPGSGETSLAELFASQITSLVSGVSQQSDAQRDPNQAEIMLNGVASVSEGLRKRNGTRLLAKMSDVTWGDVVIHPIMRDAGEKYLLVIGKGVLKVYDLTGREYAVHTFPDLGLSYLDTVVSAKEDIRAVSLADYTFISNTRVAPQMNPDQISPIGGRPYPHECLIFVKAANFGQTYRVVVNGVEAVVATPVAPVISTDNNGSLAVKENRVDASEIAQQLLNALAPKTGGVNYRRSGSVLWLTSANPISVGATDAQSGQDIAIFTDTVESFTSLPARAPLGYQMAVQGRPDVDTDDYYLTFKTRDGQGDFGEGAWAESVASGMEYRALYRTWPHALVRLKDGSFLFGPLGGRSFTAPGQTTSITLKRWGYRTAGDYLSSPDPSFIGKPINDIFIYRNRMGFLADEAVILSRPGDFFDFFSESVTTTSDADPIDILASGNRVSVLRYAVPAQSELVLFSDQTQFHLGTDAVGLTASTVSVKVLTQYEIDIRCRPVQVGGSIVFAQANGEWTRFQEMRLRGSGTSISADVEDLTGQVPSYIPNGVFSMQVEEASGSWYSLSDANTYKRSLWVNKFFWRNNGDGQVRVQNSWGEWKFDGIARIWQILALKEMLYLITQKSGKMYLEIMPITDPVLRGRQYPPPLLLDRRFSAPPGVKYLSEYKDHEWHELSVGRSIAVPSPSFDRDTGMTTWVLPFAVDTPHEVWSGNQAIKGRHFIGTMEAGDRFSAFGDWTVCHAVFGIPIDFRYRFTRFKPYQQLATSKVARSAVRAQVRKALLRYHHTDFFRVSVLAEGREPAVYVFNRHQMGTRNNLLGEPTWDLDRELEQERYLEGVFSIPILGRGDTTIVEISNDSALPCKFSSLEYVGLLHGKSGKAA